jgi:hypothetical protein
MERFGAMKNGLRIAKRLRNMVGTRRLELLTSTVSIIPLQQLTWRRETAKYPQRRVRQTNHGWDLWGRIDWKSRCFSVHWNLHPDCKLPGICPFCARATWCESSSAYKKTSVQILRWLCGLTVLAILAMATCAKANAGTIAGNIQTATGAGVTNGTLGFTLSQNAVLSGTATLVTQTTSCYTSQGGAVVGLPDPLVLPSTSTNTASGTLPSGTYYVQLWYVNGSSHSLAGPEQVVVLGALGTVNVNPPNLQPASASGYAVAIGSTSGGETLQGTVTGWTQYQQSTALVTGAAIPSSNNSTCQLAFSDTLVPTGTFYTVSLINQNGSPVAGFPQTWCTYGGLSGTINVSNGAPTGNCSTAGVFYPTPLFANGFLTQSVGGNLNVGGNFGVTGNIVGSGNLNVAGATTTRSLNAIKFADQFPGGSVTAKIDAAIASCPAYTGAAGDSCTIILVPGMGCGEFTGSLSPSHDNIFLTDYRNCLQSTGLRYNLSAAVTGNVRSKLYIQDNFDASASGLSPSKSSATLYVADYIDNPQATNQTFAAINGSIGINSQGGNFTGTLVGGEFTAGANSTNGTPRTVSDMRGLLGNGGIGGNTSATQFVSVYGQNPINTGSGTITNIFNLYLEDPGATAAGLNLSLFSKGKAEFDRNVAIGTIPAASAALLINNLTNQPTTGASQDGIQVALRTGSDATTEGTGMLVRADTAASAYTQALNDAIHIQNPVKGAGSAITEADGLLIDDITSGSTNFALKTLGAAKSSFNGGVVLGTSVAPDGSGFKHKRVAGCATAASLAATCTTTVTWTTAFADASYSATCNGDLITSGVPLNGGLTAKLAASVTFQTVSGTAAAAQYTTVDCIAVHD